MDRRLGAGQVWGDLNSLASLSGDEEVIRAAKNLPYAWHADFRAIASAVAVLLFMASASALIQGKLVSSLNKSNALIREMAAIARK